MAKQSGVGSSPSDDHISNQEFSDAEEESPVLTYPDLKHLLNQIPEDRRHSIAPAPTAPSEGADSLWTVQNRQQLLHQVTNDSHQSYEEFVSICHDRDVAVSVAISQQEKVEKLTQEVNKMIDQHDKLVSKNQRLKR